MSFFPHLFHSCHSEGHKALFSFLKKLSRFSIFPTYSFISVTNNFLLSQFATVYRHHTFSKLARFKHFLVQKMMRSSALPLFQQWQEFVAAHKSKSPITEEIFVLATRVLLVFEKVGSYYS